MGENNKFINFFYEMGPWQFVLLSCFLYGGVQVGGKYYREHQLNQVMSRSVQSESTWAETGMPTSCKDKEKCLIVYVAPWCGVCRMSEPTFRSLFILLPKLRPKMGFAIMIGDDKPAKNLAKKSELAPIETLIDDSGALFNAQNIRAFPTWMVTDSKGKEIFRIAAGFSETSETELNDILRNHFGI